MNTCTPNLCVPDVNKAVSFYQEVLGAEVVLSVPEEGTFEFVILKMGQIELMLQQKESLEKEVPYLKQFDIGGSFALYIKVDDVHALHNKIADQVEIVMPLTKTFYGSEEFSIKDCNGYVLAFAEFKS